MADRVELQLRRYAVRQQREQRWLNGGEVLTPFHRRRLALYQRRQMMVAIGEALMEVGATVEEARQAFVLLGNKVLEELQPYLDRVTETLGQAEIERGEGLQNLYAAMPEKPFRPPD